MNINQIRDLLKKYQDDTCTKEERDIIDRWLDEYVQESNVFAHGTDIDSKLKRIKRKIDRSVNTPIQRKLIYLRVAACIVLFVSAGVLYRISSSDNAQQLTESKSKVSRLINNGWVKLRSPRGSTYSFKLPDGSDVVLNASSVLKYPQEFDGSKRPVYLDEGEAYFSVAKDTRRPFTVYTPRFATTALGTAFNVRTYSREHRVSVALLQGRVKVEDRAELQGRKKAIVLNLHQKIILNTITESVINKVFTDESTVSDWRQGILCFENATAEEVITKIENRFNVGIRNSASHSNWSYTGSFRDETLDEVLQTVCITEGVTFKYISVDSIQIN